MADCPSAAHGTPGDPYGCYERERQVQARIESAVTAATARPVAGVTDRHRMMAAQITGSMSEGDLEQALRADIAQTLANAEESAWQMGFAEAAGKPGVVRVLRVIEYAYPDAETMAKDRANWQVQGLSRFGNVRMNSVVLAPEVIE